MYPAAFEYHAPTSVQDALGLLGRYKDDAKILAGGHSLVPMMKLRLAQPKHVIDLRKVSGLKGIREDGGAVVIGALTTHWEMESSAVLKSKCPVLAETASVIGIVGGTRASMKRSVRCGVRLARQGKPPLTQPMLTIPGSPAYVGKASIYRVNVPGFQIDLKGHNAVSGSFRFVG